MVNKLPKITYNVKGIGKRRCNVDFKLEELRYPLEKGKRKFKSIRFTNMPEGKNSAIKKKLRALRFRTFRQEFMPGLDN
jgi:hypothetical protein